MSFRSILVVFAWFAFLDVCSLATAQDKPTQDKSPQEKAAPKEYFTFGVHDPCIAKEAGKYYVFSTHGGIGMIESDDLIHWKRAGRVFEKLPDWTFKDIPGSNGDPWAPDIAYFNGRFHLYYSVSTFGSNRSCIGLATNKTLDPKSPDYKWEDQGKVIESQKSDDWNAIDSNVVLDGETPWMSLGSCWNGIKMCRLDPKTGKRADDKLISVASRAKENKGGSPISIPLEAPFIVRNGDYFYLFVSFDFCCRGLDSTYKIMVGRSKKVTGPFTDKEGKPMLEGGGSLVLEKQSRFVGPGGQSVLVDGDKTYLVYHFYDAEMRGMSFMQIRPLKWENDWPKVGDYLPGTDQPPVRPPRPHRVQ